MKFPYNLTPGMLQKKKASVERPLPLPPLAGVGVLYFYPSILVLVVVLRLRSSSLFQPRFLADRSEGDTVLEALLIGVRGTPCYIIS